MKQILHQIAVLGMCSRIGQNWVDGDLPWNVDKNRLFQQSDCFSNSALEQRRQRRDHAAAAFDIGGSWQVKNPVFLFVQNFDLICCLLHNY